MNGTPSLTNLLNTPFDSFPSMSEIHYYVRQLRTIIIKQHNELAYYRDTTEYLKRYTPHQLASCELFYEYKQVNELGLLCGSDRKWALTITFDPNRFTNIDLTTVEEQTLYIKYQLMKTIRRFNIPLLYGSFERHKNGRIHFHGIISIYDITEIEKYLKRKFTNNPQNRNCILWKPIDNMQKWLEYVNKESESYIYYSKPLNDINSLDL